MIQTRIAIHRETRCYKTTRIQPTITVLRTSVRALVCTSFGQFLIAFLILVLNSDDLNTSGSSNNPNSKLGMHIKSEDPATDPLAGVDGNNPNFGGPNNPSGPNRPNMSPDRIQPLPSNVVNKQSNSMDVSLKTTDARSIRLSLAFSFQYMQQQSQIFVFSTNLANRSAEAVRSGQYPTIIAYHCDQPETKKFLQVNRFEQRFGTISHANISF